MVNRTLKISKNNSLFLFGARGTGKTTYIKNHFQSPDTLWIDLLNDDDEEKYSKHPSYLSLEIEEKKPKIVVIDEIQKIPKLLDIVHLEIEKNKKRIFVLTGSSARKLKRGGANLLAGRAFTYHLYPLTHEELGDSFSLLETLLYGSLPNIYSFTEKSDKLLFLKSYVKTYLKEEIVAEQIVRKIDSFRDFLPIAAQMSGEIINYSKIAKDVGIDDKTVEVYFQILEETLIGARLPAFHRSLRKQQRQAPKFFLFDQGVKRALLSQLTLDVVPGSSEYGKSFEEWLVLECIRLNDYHQCDFEFSYLRTKDDLEIDLVVKRPGQKSLLIEIKSTDKVLVEDAKHTNLIMADYKKDFEAYLFSNDKSQKIFGDTLALHWRDGLKKIGLI